MVLVVVMLALSCWRVSHAAGRLLYAQLSGVKWLTFQRSNHSFFNAGTCVERKPRKCLHSAMSTCYTRFSGT